MSRNSGGFTLVEILIVLAMMGMAAYAMMSLMSIQDKSNLRENVVTTALEIRGNFTQVLGSSLAWTNTAQDPLNTSMECLRNLGDCFNMSTPDSSRVFELRNAANQLYYAGLDPKSGFTQGGSPCGTYPSAACPLRLVLTWQALCGQAPPCPTPQVQVTGTLNYYSGTAARNIAYNPANYGFSLTLPPPVGAPPSLTGGVNEGLAPLCQILATQMAAAGGTGGLQSQLQAMGYSPSMISAALSTCGAAPSPSPAASP